jgi:hypothetical protein
MMFFRRDQRIWVVLTLIRGQTAVKAVCTAEDKAIALCTGGDDQYIAVRPDEEIPADTEAVYATN